MNTGSMRTFVIEFYYGSGSGSATGKHYGSRVPDQVPQHCFRGSVASTGATLGHEGFKHL